MLQEIDRRFLVRKRFLEPIAPNIPPNFVTSLGFLTGPLAGYFLWKGEFLVALAFIFLNAASDLLDGTIARKFGKVTLKGSLLDDLADRVSDISISIGLGASFGSPLGAFSAIFLVLSSYLSLQGLALYGEKAKFGFFSRANRTLAIIIGLAAGTAFGFNASEPLLYAIIAGSIFTILERSIFLFSKKEGRAPSKRKRSIGLGGGKKKSNGIN